MDTPKHRFDIWKNSSKVVFEINIFFELTAEQLLNIFVEFAFSSV